MRSGRIIAAGVLALASVTAGAVPVTMTNPFIQWNSDEYVNLGNPHIYMGDCRSTSCSGFDHGGYTVTMRDGVETATSYHYGELDYSMSYNSGDTSFDFHSFEEVSASVDGVGTAMGAIKIYRFIMSFDVHETSLYTGTFDLYSGDALYSPSLVEYQAGGWIDSGTVIGPGRYSTTVAFADFLTTGFVSSGQSVYASRDTNWSYNFIAVPLPATLPLLGLGLLAIGWARRRNY